VNRVVDDLKRLGIDMPKKFDVRVENLVCSTQIYTQGALTLEDVAFSLENTEYEPESFPGLVFRVQEPRVAFLLFGTGKIICTGGRNMEDIQMALGKFKEKLAGVGVEFKAAG
jgi:transcription initiation factor TFIID TATA-box-binding protein